MLTFQACDWYCAWEEVSQYFLIRSSSYKKKKKTKLVKLSAGSQHLGARVDKLQQVFPRFIQAVQQ